MSLFAKHRSTPLHKGFTPDDISIYEKSEVLYETAKIVQEITDMAPLVNKYGPQSVLQMALNVAINNEYNPKVRRHVMGPLYEVKEVKLQKEDPFIYNVKDMVQHQKVIF